MKINYVETNLVTKCRN